MERDDRSTPTRPSRPPGGDYLSLGESESTRVAGRDLTRSATALPGSAARRATARRSAPAAAARACRRVSGASPRRSHRPSADRPDTRGPCSLARGRRCGRASPRVNAAYRWRRATTQRTSLPPFESRLLTSPLYRPGAEPATAHTPHGTRVVLAQPLPGKRQQGPRRRDRCCSDASARHVGGRAAAPVRSSGLTVPPLFVPRGEPRPDRRVLVQRLGEEESSPATLRLPGL